MEYKNIHKDVVEGCKKGDRKSQQQLYQLYSRAMYNICFRMFNNQADAEDLLQNSFVDVFTKLHYFRFDSSIGAWIKRIVINNCINYLKKKRLALTDIGDREFAAINEEVTDWDEVEFSVKKVQQAIEQLPEGYRVVLSLYLLEGYDHQEIAEILSITPSTSKSQYSRAKKKLRALITND